MRAGLSTVLGVTLLAASVSTHAQTTGGQGTNQATPMQQAPAGTASGVSVSRLSDREFIAAAAIANRYEIEAAELAVAQGGDPKLKDFARMMLSDHKKALADLETAAKQAGVSMPTASTLDQTHATKLSSLEARKDQAEFDKAYRGDQIQAHQQTVALLETYQRTGANEPLRAWAATTLPVVNKHLDMLNSMN